MDAGTVEREFSSCSQGGEITGFAQDQMEILLPVGEAGRTMVCASLLPFPSLVLCLLVLCCFLIQGLIFSYCGRWEGLSPPSSRPHFSLYQERPTQWRAVLPNNGRVSIKWRWVCPLFVCCLDILPIWNIIVHHKFYFFFHKTRRVGGTVVWRHGAQ